MSIWCSYVESKNISFHSLIAPQIADRRVKINYKVLLTYISVFTYLFKLSRKMLITYMDIDRSLLRLLESGSHCRMLFEGALGFQGLEKFYVS